MSHIFINPVTSCQLCDKEFDSETPMFDCRLIPYSTWVNICGNCFTDCGCKLGVGLGQKYELQELDDDKGAWVKVKG